MKEEPKIKVNGKTDPKPEWKICFGTSDKEKIPFKETYKAPKFIFAASEPIKLDDKDMNGFMRRIIFGSKVSPKEKLNIVLDILRGKDNETLILQEICQALEKKKNA